MKKVLSVLMAVLMLSAVFAVAVSAEEYPSPSARDYWVVEVDVDGNGTATADPVQTPKGDTSKIVAKPDAGNEFTGWTFEGEFEWVEGDANSAVIVIRPLGDVKFIAHFKGEGPGKDDGKTSPTTGYAEFVTVVVVAVLSISAAAVVVTGKKYFSAR